MKFSAPKRLKITLPICPLWTLIFWTPISQSDHWIRLWLMAKSKSTLNLEFEKGVENFGGAKFACPVLSTQNQDYTFTNNRGQIILHQYRMRSMAPGAPTLKHLIIPHLAPSKRANVRFAMAIAATVTAADANTAARPSHLKISVKSKLLLRCQIPTIHLAKFPKVQFWY